MNSNTSSSHSQSVSDYLQTDADKVNSSSKDNLNFFENNNFTASSNLKVETAEDEHDFVATPSIKKAIVFCISIAMCGFIFGWDVGTIGGITNMHSFKNTFGTEVVNGEKALPHMLVGVIISIFNIGCAVGGLTLAKIGDYRGRKVGIYFSMAVYVVGILVQIITPNNSSGNWYQFFIGRILTGLAVGSTAVLAPMFISETAPLKIRGSMIVMYQLIMTSGILVGGITNYIVKKAFTENTESHAQWQIPIALGLLWSAIVVLGTFISPESPVYLANKKKRMSRIGTEQKQALNWKESFVGKPRLGYRLLIGCLAMVFQQTSGINYFFYYGTSLFDKVGLEDPYTTAIILATVNFFATFGGIYLVERLGRKNLLLLGSVGGFLSMMIYASVGSFALNGAASGAIMIVFTCSFIIFFAIALGPVTFVLVSELYPARVKTLSMAIATSLNWFSNFLIGLLTPTITDQIGYKFGYVFAVFLFASSVFVYTMVPETKGLTSEEIDDIYEKKK